jgi:AcrR family transcriptional regulator
MEQQVEKPAVQLKERRNREVELLKAALNVFARKGYAAASVQDVADAVGVLKGSLYHYIDSKEDLLFRLFDTAHVEHEQLMAEVQALDVDPLERLRVYLERDVQKTLLNHELTTLYFRDWRNLTGERLQKLVDRRRQYDHFFRQLVAQAYDSADLTPTMDLRYIASFVIGGTNWVAEWYREDGPDSADVVAKGYADLAMASILGSAEKKARA